MNKKIIMFGIIGFTLVFLIAYSVTVMPSNSEHIIESNTWQTRGCCAEEPHIELAGLPVTISKADVHG